CWCPAVVSPSSTTTATRQRSRRCSRPVRCSGTCATTTTLPGVLASPRPSAAPPTDFERPVALGNQLRATCDAWDLPQADRRYLPQAACGTCDRRRSRTPVAATRPARAAPMVLADGP